MEIAVKRLKNPNPCEEKNRNSLKILTYHKFHMKFRFLVSNTQTDWDDAETRPKPTSACMSYAGMVTSWFVFSFAHIIWALTTEFATGLKQVQSVAGQICSLPALHSSKIQNRVYSNPGLKAEVCGAQLTGQHLCSINLCCHGCGSPLICCWRLISTDTITQVWKGLKGRQIQ